MFYKVHQNHFSMESNIPEYSAQFRPENCWCVFSFWNSARYPGLVLRKIRVELDGGDTGETIETPEIGCHPAEGGKKKILSKRVWSVSFLLLDSCDMSLSCYYSSQRYWIFTSFGPSLPAADLVKRMARMKRDTKWWKLWARKLHQHWPRNLQNNENKSTNLRDCFHLRVNKSWYWSPWMSGGG